MGRQAGSYGLVGVLERLGYEPRAEGGATVLVNCPFDALAREHTDTVCGMNLHLLSGILAGLGKDPARARLEPGAGPGRCCVLIG
ncbi:hypothetical protein ACTVZO_00615 [Streptomyces sp. IBSNAI002]|uniref:hypothetical protein n=1 Tax=Streptomyces sp. IBSNAI002 TaxID=3457500 RepID=UPI003FD6692C